MIEYKDGAILSPEDKRDWKLSRAMDLPCGSTLNKMIPKNFRIKWLPKIKDQGGVSSCTAFALSLAYSCLIHAKTGADVDYSIIWLYGNRRESAYRGKGAIIRDAVKTATKYGEVEYFDLPGNIEMLEAMNVFEENFANLQGMSEKLIEGYVRLETEEEAKAWMVKYPEIPIIAVVTMNDLYNMVISTGRHCMALVGWIGNKATFQNSWGKIYSYPEIEFSKIQEMWGLIPMATEKTTFKDVQPDRWSANAIMEAAEDGIIEGFPDGTFAPDKAPTREQIAVIWQRMKRYFDSHFEVKNDV